MALGINTNLMAKTAARNLNDAYGKLGTSVARLSSGNRINSSADDAAGLAIRELMRAEVKGLNQGVRNANDAISMIQTADGSLGIIDEKLIRMKELAEQAATGTYSSDQRQMIESEYQQMASEITRIANATSFNGIHLLNGNLSGSEHNGKGVESTGKLKVHFGTNNESAEDYYYVQIGNSTASALGVGDSAYTTKHVEEYKNNGDAAGAIAGKGSDPSKPAAGEVHIDAANVNKVKNGNTTNLEADKAYEMEDHVITEEDIKNGMKGKVNDTVKAVKYEDKTGSEKDFTWVKVKGQVSDGSTGAAEKDIYVKQYKEDVTEHDDTVRSDANTVSTQEAAQKALVGITNAIRSKDQIRANLGAMQNRLENTVNNLTIQSENLNASASRISDADVSVEMTEFVRNQIVTQSAVAMLSQANSLPKMAMSLING